MEIALRYAASILIAGLTVVSAHAYDRVGFRQLHLPAAQQVRALDMVVWYPSEPGGTPIVVGGNAVIVGQSVHEQAPITAGHPLVVLPHGYGGNWTNEGWLAFGHFPARSTP